MREIPAEVKELLKSRSMIGADKPSHEVTVNTLPSSSYDWENTANAWHRPSTNYAGDLTIAKKSNGKLIVVNSLQGTFYEGECTMEDLLTKDNSVSAWLQINIPSNGGYAAVSRVGNYLFLCVTDKGISGTRSASTKLYKSPSGNGGDWEYYSTINSIAATWANYTKSVNYNGAGCIIILSNGRWVIPCGKFGAESGYLYQNYAVYTSDDNGLAWTYRMFMRAYAVWEDYYEQGCPKHVAVDKTGNLFVCNGSNQGGIDLEFYRSIDNGATWVQTLTENTSSWGIGTYASDFELISSGDGGLYLYCNELSSGYKTRIYKIDNPINYPSVRTIVKDYSVEVTGFTNPTMQEIDNELIITKKNYVLGISSIIVKLPVKTINVSRNKNMAGSLSLSIDNKNGEWSPDNTVHQNVLFPNSEMTVKQGYGAELVQTFKGLIDRVELTTFPQEIKLSHRDMLKKALDQTITSGTSHVITYTVQTVEAIFIDLCSKAGLATGTIETTGLTLAEKTFSWETYADCFSWLADLVGFEYGADEEGNVYFKRDAMPSAKEWILTFTNGTAQAYAPIVKGSETLKTSDEITTYIRETDYTIDYETGEITSITIPDGQVLMGYVFAVYSFKEGVDIISLGYTIDDNDLYSKVVVYGKDENDAVISAEKEYVSKDYYKVLSQKIMKIDVSEASTVEQLKAIADRAEMLMRSRVREVTFAAIAVPWLQVGDLIQVVESSTTISEIYRVTDLSTMMDNNGYMMQVTCYHHSA